jgi:hypothetical protein
MQRPPELNGWQSRVDFSMNLHSKVFGYGLGMSVLKEKEKDKE